MNIYINEENQLFLRKASHIMLFDKFQLQLSDDQLQKDIENISNQVLEEYKDSNLRFHELNNITLSKLRDIYKVQTVETVETVEKAESKEDVFDQDLIHHKLKELELRRQLIPEYGNEKSYASSSNTSYGTGSAATVTTVTASASNESTVSQVSPTPISITLPHGLNDKVSFKTFIISSINRDWEKNPVRNNIKCNISVDTSNNNFYPHCICFPKHVKDITPYVLMSISDGIKNVYYSLTCTNSNGKWDIWSTVDNIEKIGLTNNQWSIKFFDFTNRELDLGEDGINIVEVSNTNDKNTFHLKTSSKQGVFDVGDVINIRTNDLKHIYKKITAVDEHGIHIFDETSNLSQSDFLNSKLLIAKNQYSIIIKYNYSTS